MKTKVLIQILILAFVGALALPAQEIDSREIKKDMRKAKREMRKAKKHLKKNMKDFHLDAFHFDGDEFEGIVFDRDWDDEAIILHEGELDRLEDVLEDLETDLEGLEFLHELEPFEYHFEIEPLEHIHELEAIRELDLELPEVFVKTPDIDVRLPGIYKYETFDYDQGNVLELSKDLEDVSISKDFYFDVEDGAETLNMNIEGALTAGDLTITVKKPDGDDFQKFQISPLADVDWSQNLNLNEDGVSHVGKWTISLSGSGATGNYNLKFKVK